MSSHGGWVEYVYGAMLWDTCRWVRTSPACRQQTFTEHLLRASTVLGVTTANKTVELLAFCVWDLKWYLRCLVLRKRYSMMPF